MSIEVDWTKPIRMKRDHYPVRLICKDRNFTYDPRFKFVILIDHPDNGEMLASCMADGRLFDVPDDSPNAYMLVENWEGVQ